MAEHRRELNENIGRPADDEVIGTGEPLDDDDFEKDDEIDEEEDEEA